MRITVVGGGIVGLSAADRLAEAGHDVTIVTAGKPEDATSAIAGGLLYPPMANPDERILRWTAAGLAEFRRQGAPGFRERRGWIQVAPGAPDPVWLAVMDRPSRSGDRLEFTTGLVDTPAYLAWLADRVAARGVHTEYRKVASLTEFDGVVVNAAGLAGGALAGDDHAVVPVGGQVVHLADPGLTGFAVDESGPGITYVLPHGRHVVCGGTEEPGRPDVEPNPAVAEDIVRRCRALVPELASAEVLGTKVGLRPYRPSVRVERVGKVIHCYGHGGAGITLAWGCAAEVEGLVSGVAGY